MTKPVTIEIDRERCKGCELCAAFCPKKIIRPAPETNSFGYHPAELFDPARCTGCGICALVCPDTAIAVRKEEAA